MRRALLVAVLLGTAAASTAASATDPPPAPRKLDLVASANPTSVEPVVADNAYDAVVTHRRTVKSDAVATGSATCDGCNAVSTALQVVLVDRGELARLDNTATAWTQECVDCAARSLSVQVAVLRNVPALAPNNRALAVNAACDTCTATSLAYQVVVKTRTVRELTPAFLREMRAWVADQAAALEASAPPPAARRGVKTARSALGSLEALVTRKLDARTVSSDVEVRR
jgi:hypothetical protein